MKNSTQKLLVQEDRRSYLIEVTKFNNGIEDDKFKIPVIDVRDGEEARKKVNSMLRDNNSSIFTKPSFSVIGKSYQVSHKKVK